MCADAPDTSRADATAERLAGLSQQQWDWITREYERTQPQRDASAARQNQISDAQLEQMQIATGQARRNMALYQPLEQRVVDNAMAYDTPERRAEAAGQASTDVQRELEAQSAASRRNLMRLGVNPNDGAYAAMESQREIAGALGSADAENRARMGVEAVGHGMLMDAASLGRNIASSQAAQVQTTLAAGNASAGTSAMPGAGTAQAMNWANQGYSAAQQGLASAGNIYEQSARTQAQDTSGVWNTLGNIAGMGLRMYRGGM